MAPGDRWRWNVTYKPRLRILLLKQKGTHIKIKDQPFNTLPGPDTNVIDLAIVSTWNQLRVNTVNDNFANLVIMFSLTKIAIVLQSFHNNRDCWHFYRRKIIKKNKFLVFVSWYYQSSTKNLTRKCKLLVVHLTWTLDTNFIKLVIVSAWNQLHVKSVNDNFTHTHTVFLDTVQRGQAAMRLAL